VRITRRNGNKVWKEIAGKKRHFVLGTAEIIHSRSVSLATSGWTRKRFAETNVRHATSISERQKQV